MQKKTLFLQKEKVKQIKKGLLTNVKAKEGVVVIKDTTKAAFDDSWVSTMRRISNLKRGR